MQLFYEHWNKLKNPCPSPSPINVEWCPITCLMHFTITQHCFRGEGGGGSFNKKGGKFITVWSMVLARIVDWFWPIARFAVLNAWLLNCEDKTAGMLVVPLVNCEGKTAGILVVPLGNCGDKTAVTKVKSVYFSCLKAHSTHLRIGSAHNKGA